MALGRPAKTFFFHKTLSKKIVHFAPESIVHFTPECVVQYTPKYSFVALANHLDAYLWTGDRPLFEGLEMKEYLRLIPTDKIITLYFQKELRNKKRRR
jgi:hypothetical protein